MLFIGMLIGRYSHSKRIFVGAYTILCYISIITTMVCIPTFQASLLFVSTTSLPRRADSDHGLLDGVEMPIIVVKKKRFKKNYDLFPFIILSMSFCEYL